MLIDAHQPLRKANPIQMILHDKTSVKLIYILFIIAFVSVSQPILAQHGKSITTLLTPASEEDQAKLPNTYIAKVKHLKQIKAYKQVQIVKVGNLAKIQKKGVLIFTLPDSTETFIYFAQKVVAQSELDFTWIGVSADKLSTAIFICKNGKLSGTFGINGRGFQLSPTDEGLSVLIEDRVDLPVNCDSK